LFSKEAIPINTQNFLPLREPTFFILLSLAQGKKHGYAILKDVESLSNGKIVLSNGTLYGALVRLLDQGLIERLSSEEPHNPGRPRKAYQLTKDGLTVLQAEISRLQNMLGRAQLPMAEESV
jgi:PadR family transcriptional regulator PadR